VNGEPRWADSAARRDALIVAALARPDWYETKVAPRLVEAPGGCLIWTGARNRGYGMVGLPDRGPVVKVHRVNYLRVRGAIPRGLSLDHLCRNPPCCLPAHLEPVTHRENMLRSPAPAARAAERTHCPNGHPLVPGNLAVTNRSGRQCLTCQRARDAASDEAVRRAAAVLGMTGAQYRVAYGRSVARAEQIIAEHAASNAGRLLEAPPFTHAHHDRLRVSPDRGTFRQEQPR
jgi:hypothetical protein